MQVTAHFALLDGILRPHKVPAIRVVTGQCRKAGKQHAKHVHPATRHHMTKVHASRVPEVMLQHTEVKRVRCVPVER